MYVQQNLYGLVLCGGGSTRMGEDKSFLIYHHKPQYQHVCEMLQEFCLETYISCNHKQSETIYKTFKRLEDEQAFENNGPATGVMTAFSKNPEKDFLVVACDYPLLTTAELKHFLESIPASSSAAAFYNEYEQCYEPVIAWYSAGAGSLLLQLPQSLKQLLENVNAYKHIPLDAASITSADTKAAREKIVQLTNCNH